jgi:hypothetical protein
MFFTKYDWRTLSERPEFMLMPDFAAELYTPFRSIRDRNEVLLGLYGLGESWRRLSLLDIINQSLAGYTRLTAADFATLSRRFSVPYLVRGNDEAPLDFPIAYQNRGFRIYRLAP